MPKPSQNPWQLTDDSEKREVVSLVLLYGTGGMIDRWHKKFPDRHSGDNTKDKAAIRDATRKCNPNNDSHCSQRWKDEYSAQKCLIDEGRRAELQRAVTRVITEIEADLDEVKDTDLEKALLLVHKQEAKSKIVSRLIEFQDRIEKPHEISNTTGHGHASRSAKPTSFERVKSIFKVSSPETYDG